MPLEPVFFFLFASVALVFAFLMVTRTSALSAAICLVVCFLGLAGLYALLNAPLVAVLQVIVYAGAIMMLIVFVIMTVDLRQEELAREKPAIVGSVAAGAIVVVCLYLLSNASAQLPLKWSVKTGQAFGTVENIGRVLFTRHVLNFEMISILLLVALIGALVLGKKQSQK